MNIIEKSLQNLRMHSHSACGCWLSGRRTLKQKAGTLAAFLGSPNGNHTLFFTEQWKIATPINSQKQVSKAGTLLFVNAVLLSFF